MADRYAIGDGRWSRDEQFSIGTFGSDPFCHKPGVGDSGAAFGDRDEF